MQVIMKKEICWNLSEYSVSSLSGKLYFYWEKSEFWKTDICGTVTVPSSDIYANSSILSGSLLYADWISRSPVGVTKSNG